MIFIICVYFVCNVLIWWCWFLKLVHLQWHSERNDLESFCLTRNRHYIHTSDVKPSQSTSGEIMAYLLVSDERPSVVVVTLTTCRQNRNWREYVISPAPDFCWNKAMHHAMVIACVCYNTWWRHDMGICPLWGESISYKGTVIRSFSSFPCDSHEQATEQIVELSVI